MKIRFFGDSWYWNWYYGHIVSSTIKNVLKYKKGFPAIEAYLNYLGIDVITYNEPAECFQKTVNNILSSANDDSTFNVVFVSSFLRGLDANPFDFTNYDEFMLQWDLYMISNLRQLQNWAEKNNQHVLLIGGQGTLYKHVFEKVKNRKNLHLLSECIISTLTNRNPPHGIFKVAIDIPHLVNKKWHPKLVHHLYDDLDTWEKDKDKLLFMYPDFGHLNPNGSFLLLDMILYKIEEIEKNYKNVSGLSNIQETI